MPNFIGNLASQQGNRAMDRPGTGSSGRPFLNPPKEAAAHLLQLQTCAALGRGLDSKRAPPPSVRAAPPMQRDASLPPQHARHAPKHPLTRTRTAGTTRPWPCAPVRARRIPIGRVRTRSPSPLAHAGKPAPSFQPTNELLTLPATSSQAPPGITGGAFSSVWPSLHRRTGLIRQFLTNGRKRRRG
jgi:hypothetical protein